MTQYDNSSTNDLELLKTDSLGRVRPSPEQREALLDAYEAGGLSGPKFARVHGINYQTFASWRQKRKRQRQGGRPVVDAVMEKQQRQESAETRVTLVEAVVTPLDTRPSTGERGRLIVELPGGARCVVESKETVDLAAELLRNLGMELSTPGASC